MKAIANWVLLKVLDVRTKSERRRKRRKKTPHYKYKIKSKSLCVRWKCIWIWICTLFCSFPLPLCLISLWKCEYLITKTVWIHAEELALHNATATHKHEIPDTANGTLANMRRNANKRGKKSFSKQFDMHFEHNETKETLKIIIR